MAKLVYERVGGQTVHVGDCHVWAEIFYLDSSTNYREYLPRKSDEPLSHATDLVMLDGLNSRSKNWGLFLLVLVPILFLIGFILYCSGL